MVPQSACGGGSPSPRKLSVDRARIASATLKVALSGRLDVSRLRGDELRRKRRDLQLMFHFPLQAAQSG
jgi:hypothetical protein